MVTANEYVIDKNWESNMSKAFKYTTSRASHVRSQFTTCDNATGRKTLSSQQLSTPLLKSASGQNFYHKIVSWSLWNDIEDSLKLCKSICTLKQNYFNDFLYFVIVTEKP